MKHRIELNRYRHPSGRIEGALLVIGLWGLIAIVCVLAARCFDQPNDGARMEQHQ